MLRYLSRHANGWQITNVLGVESEMELAYSSLHQLCAPMLDHVDHLPVPQRDALATVFGQSTGTTPDRFLVGLATLTLLAETAERQPLLCIVDDAQWLDHTSAEIVSFVARRLLAERVAFVCAARTGIGDNVLSDLAELPLHGLGEGDARALLLDNVYGPLDAAVCDQIVTESRGNPLALLELPRTWNAGDLAGGFGLPGSQPIIGKIEQSYAKRLRLLPDATQLLVLAAAAEPLGDPVLLHGAAEGLGLDMAVADPAVDAGLLEVGGRVGFAHPLVRSAVYRSASRADRHRVHRALAAATDPEIDPDRRAWHLACAESGPVEEVATELERSAGRAQSRGGLAAAAAFLERAAALTSDPRRRAERALVAAQVKYEAGSLPDAGELLSRAELGPLDDLQRCQVTLLRAHIAFAAHRSTDGRPLLLQAARDAETADADLARVTYLEALHAVIHAGRMDTPFAIEVSETIAASPAASGPRRAGGLLLHGLAERIAHGPAAGAPMLKEALAGLRAETLLPTEDARWATIIYRVASAVSLELWDDEMHLLLAARELERTRTAGALAALPTALETRSVSHALAGELNEAASLLDEMRLISEATGIHTHNYGELLLTALRGREPTASSRITQAAKQAAEHGDGLGLASAEYMTALLYNGLGRYAEAAAAVRHAGEHPSEIGAPTRAAAELVEAAARSGDGKLAQAALERLSDSALASGTDWALGVQARCRALLKENGTAEDLYREAIDRLARTRLRPELARAHLVYGEWLRREGRRVNAREQLRTAREMLVASGMEAFGERARGELMATGEKVRKRVDETRGDLTPQEEQIARLARQGLSNPEIGAQLFLSARTVEWHLRKVFGKLGISSRRQLRTALSDDGRPVTAR